MARRVGLVCSGARSESGMRKSRRGTCRCQWGVVVDIVDGGVVVQDSNKIMIALRVRFSIVSGKL